MASPLESHYYWRCGRCLTWNEAGRSTCSRCGASDKNHDAVQKEERLHPSVAAYYQTTGPLVLRELRSIRHVLGRIMEKLDETFTEDIG